MQKLRIRDRSVRSANLLLDSEIGTDGVGEVFRSKRGVGERGFQRREDGLPLRAFLWESIKEVSQFLTD